MSRRYKGGVISATAPTTSTSSATGVWTLPQQMVAQAASAWPAQPAPPSSQSYTTAGTYSWVAPAGVTKVSVVAVGPGMSTCQAGGGLGWINNYTVIPANSYTVKVGAAGVSSCHSYFVSACTVRGGASTSGNNGGTYIGTGGGNGGTGGYMGGGGAGGYAGNGGNGAASSGGSGTAGAGGGGGGGGCYFCCCSGQTTGGGGGGVGLFGQGSNGAGGSSCGNGGGGGSGGVSGTNRSGLNAGSGGAYGAGRGRTNPSGSNGLPSGGAVRIVWPGNTRSFPSTCVGAP